MARVIMQGPRLRGLPTGEAAAIDIEEPRYTSAEVSAVAGISRGTFDAWLLRRYFPVPAGPGTGKLRKFSFLDALRITAIAVMSRSGISVGTAAVYLDAVAEEFKAAVVKRENPPVFVIWDYGEFGTNKKAEIIEHSVFQEYVRQNDPNHILAGNFIFYSVLMISHLLAVVETGLGIGTDAQPTRLPEIGSSRRSRKPAPPKD